MYKFYHNIFLFIVVFLLMVLKTNATVHNRPLASPSLCFIENNGQLQDQFGKKRSDIQFYLAGNNFNAFVGKGQIHYQLKKAESPIGNLENTATLQKLTSTDSKNNSVPDLSICNVINRVDVELLNSNQNAEIIYSDRQEYYENYYTAGSPLNGIHANTYKKIIYKNVYPDIDWVFYLKDNKPEYEFIVGPNGDISRIKLRYSGAASTMIDEHKNLKIITSIGEITEHAPVCYPFNPSLYKVCAETKYVPANYKLTNNILTYETSEEHSLVIDPGIEWGTYYGEDSSVTMFYALSCDNMANIYACGKTYSTGLIATSGSFQDTIGGDMDACLVKFDSSGNRLWATYYGNTGGDWATGVQYDNAGHVYVGGSTNSTTGMVTPGCQQPVYGGGLFNGFLAMFTTDGTRQWCTYLGGGSATEPASVCADHIGHVYIAGLTNDGTNIATAGSYQPAQGGGHDLFIIQYDSTGARQWGTYYGGPGDEFRGDICTDASNDLYFCGWTFSSSNIASAGSFQPAIGGGSDAFLAKFNSSGARLWATYYGGPFSEITGALAVDVYDFIYLLGSTSSDSGIASSGCYQPLRGGGQDAFLAKFDRTTGNRIWCTYYGGTGDEGTDYSKIVTDNLGDVFITGTTTSTSGIVTAGVWQTIYGGGDDDGFLAKYDEHGTRLWSSYLGGDNVDQPTAISYDGLNAYVCGTTQSTDNIATPGGLLPYGGGLTWYNQGFLVKIKDYLPPSSIETADNNQNIILYPSPNSGSFTISSLFKETLSGNAKIIVSDISGKTVYNDNRSIYNRRLDVQINLDKNLPNGIYFLRIIEESEVRIISFHINK